MTAGEGWQPTPRDMVIGVWRAFFWKRPHPAVDLVARLLREPDGWSQTHFHLTHERCGVSIWITNRWCGFGVRIDGNSASPESRIPGMGWFDKRLLISHLKRHLSGQHVGTHPQVAAFAHRVIREMNRADAA